MLLRRRRLILGVLITSQILTGCTSWQVVSVSPRALVDSAHVSAVKVREKGGAEYVLEWPRIAGDSLIGTLATDQPADRRAKRVEHGIPLAVVDQVSVTGAQTASHGGGLTSILVGAAAGLVACTLISNAAKDPGTGTSSCTAQGNIIFGAGGAVVGGLIGLLIK